MDKLNEAIDLYTKVLSGEQAESHFDVQIVPLKFQNLVTALEENFLIIFPATQKQAGQETFRNWIEEFVRQKTPRSYLSSQRPTDFYHFVQTRVLKDLLSPVAQTFLKEKVRYDGLMAFDN